MDIIRHAGAESFCDRALPLLLEREAENNLMIGLALRLRASGGVNQWGEGEPLLATIEQEGRLLGAAVQTPPHNLIVTRTDARPVARLAEQLHVWGVELPGVLGPREAAARFAETWVRLRGCRESQAMSMRVYAVERLTSVPTAPGKAGPAAPEDAPLVTEWVRAFAEESGVLAHDPAATVQAMISEQRLLLWRDPDPVSMAACMGPTPSGIRIGYVYTPPDLRRRGYGTAVVAALCDLLLASGRRFCYLFADLANPIANGIYQKLGFKTISDFETFRFE